MFKSIQLLSSCVGTNLYESAAFLYILFRLRSSIKIYWNQQCVESFTKLPMRVNNPCPIDWNTLTIYLNDLNGAPRRVYWVVSHRAFKRSFLYLELLGRDRSSDRWIYLSCKIEKNSKLICRRAYICVYIYIYLFACYIYFQLSFRWI